MEGKKGEGGSGVVGGEGVAPPLGVGLGLGGRKGLVRVGDLFLLV